MRVRVRVRVLEATPVNISKKDGVADNLRRMLAQALVKFNEVLAHNKKLRDTIDDLRFVPLYRKPNS